MSPAIEEMNTIDPPSDMRGRAAPASRKWERTLTANTWSHCSAVVPVMPDAGADADVEHEPVEPAHRRLRRLDRARRTRRASDTSAVSAWAVAPSASTSATVAAQAVGVQVGAGDGGPLAPGDHGDGAPVADRCLRVVDGAGAGADHQHAPALEELEPHAGIGGEARLGLARRASSA